MGFHSPELQASAEVSLALEHLNLAITALERDHHPDQLPEKRNRLRSRIIAERTRIADLARELRANGIDPLKGL